jgi:diguanylate cyclase
MRQLEGVSRRTWTILAAGLGMTALVYVLILLKLGGEFGQTVTSDIGGIIVVGFAAIVVLLSAGSFKPGEPFRRLWVLIGAGICMYVVGDLIWTVIEVGMRGEVPYPGFSDIFYVLEYVFLGAGIIMAAVGYRRLIDVRAPLAMAAGLTALLGVALYFGVLKDVFTTQAPFGEKALNIFYPSGDLLLELMPALFIAFVVARLGRGRLARPWWAVAVGVAILAVADSSFSWLSAHDLYASGNVVDMGWMAGHTLIAVGASLAVDEIVPAPTPARPVQASAEPA